MVTANFDFRLNWINSAGIEQIFHLQCDTIILEYIADILMLEFHAGMS